MKTPQGYVAVPWQLDIRVWWYSKPIFGELGLTPPTTWDEMMTVGDAGPTATTASVPALARATTSGHTP